MVAAVPDRLLFTQRETAHVLGLSPRTIASLTATGELACLRIGRSVRYCLADIEAWIGHKKTLQTAA